MAFNKPRKVQIFGKHSKWLNMLKEF